MQQFFFTLSEFIRFYLKADTRYRVHSPFVYRFVEEVLEDDRNFYVFKRAESLRTNLLSDNKSIELTDFGAGSHIDGIKKMRKIKDIARTALSPAFQCRWLFKIVQLYSPENLIELGTSLGISTLYLSEAAPKNAAFYTLEGALEIAKIAQNNFETFNDQVLKQDFARYNKKLLKPEMLNPVRITNDELRNNNITSPNSFSNINLVVGRFEDTFESVLKKFGKVDFAFIDGNHHYDATINYFNTLLPYTHDYSVLIFDDIYWSVGMKHAWEDIKNHNAVTLTIDLFWCGLVFFRKENAEKQHFKLIKANWKPGIF